jgi:hypothetical protein
MAATITEASKYLAFFFVASAVAILALAAISSAASRDDLGMCRLELSFSLPPYELSMRCQMRHRIWTQMHLLRQFIQIHVLRVFSH